MPVQINIGLNKKVGEPNYGSRGASVHLQTELDSGVIDEPERLRTQICRLFALARRSLDEELHGATTDQRINGSEINGRSGHQITNRIADRNGHVIDGHSPGESRSATPAQIRAIHAIADHRGIDLTSDLRHCGVFRVADLSLSDASHLIDELKSRAPAAVTS